MCVAIAFLFSFCTLLVCVIDYRVTLEDLRFLCRRCSFRPASFLCLSQPLVGRSVVYFWNGEAFSMKPCPILGRRSTFLRITIMAQFISFPGTWIGTTIETGALALKPVNSILPLQASSTRSRRNVNDIFIEAYMCSMKKLCVFIKHI